MSKKVDKFKVDYHRYHKQYRNIIQEPLYSSGYESKCRLLNWLIDDIDSFLLLREEDFNKREKRETVRTKVFFENLKLEASKKQIELELKLNESDLIDDSSDENKNPKKKINDFFINITDKEKFLIELKNTFKTEKGQKIRALIEVLKKEKMLLIGEGEFRNFINELAICFNRDIGKYQGIQNKSVNWEIHTEYIKNRFTSLKSTYKKLL